MRLNEIKKSIITYEDELKIRDWLDKNVMLAADDKFSIMMDGTIIYTNYGDARIKRGVKEIPYKFGKCTGSFSCGPDMVNIKNCPISTDGEFFSVENAPNIKSLKGLPRCNQVFAFGSGITKIEDAFPHLASDLICLSLDDLPIKSWVGVEKLTKKKVEKIFLKFFDDTKGGLGLILIPGLKELSINFETGDRESEKAAHIIEKYAGKPEDLFECQAELIDNGLDRFAEM